MNGGYYYSKMVLRKVRQSEPRSPYSYEGTVYSPEEGKYSIDLDAAFKKYSPISRLTRAKVGTKRFIRGAKRLKIKRPPKSLLSKKFQKGHRAMAGDIARGLNVLIPGGGIPVPHYKEDRHYGEDRSRKTTGYRPTKRRRGRPSGPSGKYIIPGVGAVGVYEWRNWVSRQRTKARLQQAQATARLSPEEYMQQMAQQQLMRARQQEDPQYDEDYDDEDYEDEVEYSAPQRQYAQQQQVQQQVQQVRRVAPQEGSILHAPNIFRGELQGVGRNKPYSSYDAVEKPVSNPRGDYYTEVDPFTGKQILRRRPRERWAEGG